jgi:hypothetical protein
MLAIPVDVLREILEHVNKNDLATVCRVNKICCSCSQNVLYREIHNEDIRVIQTLAKSTDLARRVRSFKIKQLFPELATALRNMSSLRSLDLGFWDDASILDGCTFKLDSLTSIFPYSKLFHKFLNSQSSLTKFTNIVGYGPIPTFEETFLPNLTRVGTRPCWAPILIPGRPVREVTVVNTCFSKDSVDFSIFTLSTAPIRKLHISYYVLYPTSGSQLASIFPSLEHLTIEAQYRSWDVRIPLLYLSITGVNARR